MPPNSGQLIADLIDTSRVEITAKLPEHDRANVNAGPGGAKSPWTRCPTPTLQGSVRSVSGVASRGRCSKAAARAGSTSPSTSRGDTSRIRPGVSAALAIAGPTFDDALSHSAIGGVRSGRQDGRSTCARRRLRAARGEGRARSPTRAAVVEGLEPDAEVALVNPNATAGSQRAAAQPPRAPCEAHRAALWAARICAAASTTCCCTSCAPC